MGYYKNENVIVLNRDKGIVEANQTDENVLVKLTLTGEIKSYNEDEVEYDLTHGDAPVFID